MQINFNLYSVQNAIGYVFKNAELIKAAFSYKTPSKSCIQSGDGLTIIGKYLFELIISDYIYTRAPYTDSSEFTAQVKEYTELISIQDFISENELQSNIILSDRHEKMRDSKDLHADIFFAILGAVFRDGGMPSLKAFLIPMIRFADGETKYPPKKPQSLTLIEETIESDGNIHIKKEPKVKTSSSESATSKIVRAKTVEQPQNEKEEKSSLTEKLFGKKKTVSADKAPKAEPEKAPKKETETDTKQKRSFIRDALAPVTLPEHMKTPKSKRYESKSAEQTPSIDTENTDDDKNYKSMLQEYIQKNIRSSSVLLKYNTSAISRGVYHSEIILDDYTLAKCQAQGKKSAEKAAAKEAYLKITDPKSDLNKWFAQLNGNDIIATDLPEDYISKINQHFQKKHHTASVPLNYNTKKAPDKKSYVCSLLLNGVEIGKGKAPTLRDAKQEAAKDACEMLNIN